MWSDNNNRIRCCARWHTTCLRVNFELVSLLLSSLLYWTNVLYIRPCGNVFFVSYFNDLCCGVWFLAYSNIWLALIGRRIGRLGWVLIYMCVWGCIWEFLGPIINRKSICDGMDVIVYLIGAILYWLLDRCCGLIRKCKFYSRFRGMRVPACSSVV